MKRDTSRRQFMQRATATALAVSPIISSLEALAQEAPQKKQDPLSYLNVYDSQIDRTLEYFTSIHNRAPERNLVKAMIAVETGSPEHRKTAFVYDPMQIANEGDCALLVLSNKGEHTHVLGDFSALKDKKHTPRKNGRWNYSDSNMDAAHSIFGGVGWLLHKAAVYDDRTIEENELRQYRIEKGDTFWDVAKKLDTTVKTLEKYNPNVEPKKLQVGQTVNYKLAREEWYVSRWRSTEDSLKGYNGNGNPNYFRDVIKVKEALDKRV